MLRHCQDAFGLAAAGRKRQRCNTIGNGRMERIVVAVGVWRRLGGGATSARRQGRRAAVDALRHCPDGAAAGEGGTGGTMRFARCWRPGRC